MRDKIASFIAVGKKLPKGRKWLMGAGLLTLCATASAVVIPNLFPFLDPTGLISTYNAAGTYWFGSDNVTPTTRRIPTRTCSPARCRRMARTTASW